MSPEEAMHRLYAALGSVPKASRPQVDGPWIKTSIGMSIWSWGETMVGHVQPGPGRCMVTIRSNSAVTMTLFDWGKNQKNVEAALTQLTQLARMQPQAPPPPSY